MPPVSVSVARRCAGRALGQRNRPGITARRGAGFVTAVVSPGRDVEGDLDPQIDFVAHSRRMHERVVARREVHVPPVRVAPPRSRGAFRVSKVPELAWAREQDAHLHGPASRRKRVRGGARRRAAIRSVPEIDIPPRRGSSNAGNSARPTGSSREDPAQGERGPEPRRRRRRRTRPAPLDRLGGVRDGRTDFSRGAPSGARASKPHVRVRHPRRGDAEHEVGARPSDMGPSRGPDSQSGCVDAETACRIDGSTGDRVKRPWSSASGTPAEVVVVTPTPEGGVPHSGQCHGPHFHSGYRMVQTRQRAKTPVTRPVSGWSYSSTMRPVMTPRGQSVAYSGDPLHGSARTVCRTRKMPPSRRRRADVRP